MSSSCPENDPAYFGFTDLHGFKDFLVEVYSGAPDDFMEMDWLKPEDQMNLDRAFVDLRYGLDLTAKEKGESAMLARCRTLVEESYADYKEGRDRAGQSKLEEVEKLLRRVPTK